jgi:ATP-binding cassette subfamily F protein 3
VLVSLSGVSFGYAAEEIFHDLTFQVNPKEHLGVVGPNGHGKSTLLRLIAGSLPVETGERSVRRGTEITYLRQSQEFPDGVTVHDLLIATFPEILAIEKKLAVVQARLEAGDDSEATLLEYGDLQHRFEELDGYTLESRAAALAEEVGFHEDDLKRDAGSLSGGERTRFELARVLLRQPEVLLLDEPTNHLDLVQTEKLERRLSEYPGAFLLVSHDRAFLRATCTEILEVERKGVLRYPGGYDAYHAQREARLAKALEEYIRQNEKIEKTEDFIRRNIAGQKTKQAQSRRRMLEKLERVERPEDIWEAARHLGMEFERDDHPGGREAVRAVDLAIGYDDDEPLIEGFTWTLHRGERVGIAGPNGAGKTSLLRVLLGRIPARHGYVELGYQIKIGYLDQKLLTGLDLGRSLIDEVRSVRPDLTIEGARDALGRYRFLGDDAFKVVGALSGGERCRLALLKVSLVPHNLLVFDEPTNHLDIPAREVLERALAEYDGTLLVISHDRDFLDHVTEKTLWVADGAARVFEGNYSEAKRKLRGEVAPVVKRAAPERPPPVAPTPPPAEVAPSPAPKNDKPGAQQREAMKRDRRERQKTENRLKKVEQEIEEFEARAAELAEQLSHDPGGDWERLNQLANEEQQLRGRLERRYAEWERLTRALEA